MQQLPKKSLIIVVFLEKMLYIICMSAILMILVEGLVISVAGTLLHFAYDWSRKNKRIGIIAAVNESTWEHIKIAIFPMFVTMFVDGIWFGEMPNYYIGKLISILVVIILIIALFYGYKSIAARDILVLDIAIFYIAIFAGQALFYLFTTMNDFGAILNFLALDGIFALFACSLVMTCLPAKGFLFKDPITKKYGFGWKNK